MVDSATTPVVDAPAGATTPSGLWPRVGRDASVFLAAALTMAALQIGFRTLAVKGLPVADYGKVGVLISLFNAALLIAAFGVGPTAARVTARSAPGADDWIILKSLGRAALLPTLGGCVAMMIATFLVTRSVIEAIVAGAGLPPMVFCVIVAGFLRGRRHVFRAAAIQPINALVQVAMLVFVFAIAGTGGVTLSLVMYAFYLGNVAACVFAIITLRRSGISHGSGVGIADSVRDIRAYSFWLVAANLAVVGLGVAPRLVLIHDSYGAVAVFDFALLGYSLFQRVRASVAIAMVPLAASAQRDARRVPVPSGWDAAVLAGCTLVLVGILSATHVVGGLLSVMGFQHYSGSEAIFLIVLLGAPAELLFGVSASLLQGFGQARQLASVTITVFLVSCVAFVIASRVAGPDAIACVMVVGYWALYVMSRQRLRETEVVSVSATRAIVHRLRGPMHVASGTGGHS